MKIKKSTLVIRASVIGLGLLACLFVGSPPAITPVTTVMAQEQESSASLDETLQWLIDKLDNSTVRYSNPNLYQGYKLKKLGRCQLELRSVRGLLTAGEAEYVDEGLFKIFLENLDPFGSKITDLEYEVGLTVQVPSNSKHNGILATSLKGSYSANIFRDQKDYVAPNMNVEFPMKSARVSFSKDNAGMAKRVQRAFDHAIQLCGGKTEPF